MLWDFKKWRVFVRTIVEVFSPIVLAFIVPLLITVVYFFLNNALADFIAASFSQNASYVAVGSGPFSKLSNPLFVKGVILAIGSLFLAILFRYKKISRESLLLSLWFGFSLYGALLSNRPYMHYLLQIVPPVTILVIYLLTTMRKNWLFLFPLLIIFYSLLGMFKGAFALPTKEYYLNWMDYISERKEWTDYVNWFDSRTNNSYKVAGYISQNSLPTDSIFVWGDAAFVYVLSNRKPATRFIQAHHLTTIDPKNYDLVIDKLQQVRPKFILISIPEHFAFPKLDLLVKEKYQETAVFNDLHVYQINSAI